MYTAVNFPKWQSKWNTKIDNPILSCGQKADSFIFSETYALTEQETTCGNGSNVFISVTLYCKFLSRLVGTSVRERASGRRLWFESNVSEVGDRKARSVARSSTWWKQTKNNLYMCIKYQGRINHKAIRLTSQSARVGIHKTS